MFCTKCGFKNAEDSLFCQECGTKLQVKNNDSIMDLSKTDDHAALIEEQGEDLFQVEEQNNYIPPVEDFNDGSIVEQNWNQPYYPNDQGDGGASNGQPFKKPSQNLIHRLKKIPKLAYIIAGIICILIIIGAVGGSIIKKQTSPMTMVNKYMAAYSKEEWDVVYSYLDITENQFVNKASFVKQKELDTDRLGKITNYDIIKRRTEENDLSVVNSDRDNTDLMQVYEVAYVTQNSSTTQTMEIRLNTQKKKRFLLFDTYLVNPSAFMAADCTIYAPQNSKVFVEGIELIPSKDKTSEYDENMAAYTIDYLFKGNYDITVEHPMCQQMSMDEVSFSNQENITVDPLLLKTSTIEERFQDTQAFLQQLIKGGINGEEFQSLEFPVLNTDSAKESCEAAYEDLKSHLEIDEGGVGYKSITLKGFTDISTQHEYSSDQTYISKIDFEFDYVRMVKTGWGSSKTKEERSEKTQKGTLTINYIFKDLEWQIESYRIDGIN